MSEQSAIEAIILAEKNYNLDALVKGVIKKAAELSFMSVVSNVVNSTTNTVLDFGGLFNAIGQIAERNYMYNLAQEFARQAANDPGNAMKAALARAISQKVAEIDALFASTYATAGTDFKTAAGSYLQAQGTSLDYVKKALGGAVGAVATYFVMMAQIKAHHGVRSSNVACSLLY
jgi:hypothetical protein